MADLDGFTVVSMPKGAMPTQEERAPPAAGRDAFIARYRNDPGLTGAAQELGVSPDLLLAQAGLETGWGKSIIPGTNNLGNIKDTSGRGPQATDNMTGSRDAYRAYGSTDDYFRDYADLIKRRYPGVIGAGDDPTAFAAGLKGYAEDPQYGNKLARTYDNIAGGGGSGGAGGAGGLDGFTVVSMPGRTRRAAPAPLDLSPEAIHKLNGGTDRSWAQFGGDMALKGAQGVVEIGRAHV